MAVVTGAKRAVGGKRHGRAQCFGTQAPVASKRRRIGVGELVFGRQSAGVAARRHLLGAAGRTGAAHVMQFRPVGIEGPDEEKAPELTDLGENVSLSVAAGRGGGEGS